MRIWSDAWSIKAQLFLRTRVGDRQGMGKAWPRHGQGMGKAWTRYGQAWPRMGKYQY